MKIKLANKAIKITTAIIAIASLSITAAFNASAWEDTQPKLNEAQANALKFSATLEDNFTPELNWRITDPPLTKEVYVVNPLSPLDKDAQPIFIRISLKEYLEIAKLEELHTINRFATNLADGHFLAYPDYAAGSSAAWKVDINSPIPGRIFTMDGGLTYYDEAEVKSDLSQYEADAQAWATALGYPARTLEFAYDIITGDAGWFIPTQQGDINGQYGKRATQLLRPLAPESLIPGVVRAPANDAADHDYEPANPTGEYAYTPYYFGNSKFPSPIYGSPFREYVQLNYLDTDIISMSEWDGQPTAKWIYDDSLMAQQNGLLYWGEPLYPGKRTVNVLDSIELIKQPEGPFYYAMHIDMEAVSKDSLEDVWWTNMPSSLQAPREYVDAMLRS
ncbi:MAG: hypothetical protein LBS74_11370 [Oscillospiraceae bacterium]|nr:hypothetical protein [Oscillospiraceae bacterium]